MEVKNELGKCLVVFAFVAIVALIVISQNMRITYASQIEKKSTYAIQNVHTGKNLRPYQANVDDGNKLILYNHHKWKCMTWQMIEEEEDTYQLKNMYTSKTFQPSSKLEPGVALVQQPLKVDGTQYWEFIKQPDNSYLIKANGTDLYLTISSDTTNSSIILMPKHNSTGQHWRLVEQKPWF